MTQEHIDEIRSFNRFYTNIIGLVNGYILNSHYTLPEVRVLYELYHGESNTASEIISLLRIDKGYLSRILFQFEKKKIISKTLSKQDKRSAIISLTAKGQKEFEALNLVSNNQIKKILRPVPKEDCDRLLYHMSEIKKIFSASATRKISEDETGK
jgi:DNA-binding MarR family transcriptional regulator